MSIFRRLRLDEVITSLPELGPTIPDGGYSWIVLFGIMIVQMTVPSTVLSYGIVLGHLSWNSKKDFDVWNEKITLTPILMIAFWSLADPWTKTLVNLASVPRVITFIGIALLSVGVLASGYLATGGVGAFLASSSAGAIMGIGASFVMVQSEKVLRQHFRIKLQLATTMMNVAFSIGLIVAPLVALALFTRLGIQAGMMAMVVLFLPTAIVTTIIRSPGKQISSPYTLLFNEDETESSTRMMEDSNSNSRKVGSDNRNGGSNSLPVDESAIAYSYADPEDVNLYVTPFNLRSKWKQDIKLFKFWVLVLVSAGSKISWLLFWLLLPPLTVIKIPSTNLFDGVVLSMVGGLGTLVASIISYWNPNARSRSLIFGFSNWIGSFVLIGLSYADFYVLFLVLSLLGGISIGGLMNQEFAIRDAMGSLVASNVASTCVGIAILLLAFIRNMFLCLRISGIIQFVGGLYWILSPLFVLLRAR